MKLYIQLTTLILFTCLLACSPKQLRNKEAREDAEKFAEATALQQLAAHKIMVDAETEPVKGNLGDDAADDPAIVYNWEQPEKTIIVGTDKKAGLYSYNLQGKELDFTPAGKVNNVDVRLDFPYKGEKIVLVAATNRTNQTISLFSINQSTGKFSQLLGSIATKVDDVYGFTLAQLDEKFYAFSNGKNGVIEQFLLQSESNKISGKKVAEYQVNSQPEGMVVDEENGLLYVGVEEEEIVSFNVNETNSKAIVLAKSNANVNTDIAYDIEGLSLFEHENNTYLIASIQGSFTYALYNVTDPQNTSYITNFALVGNNNGIDGAEETDGLESLDLPMGKNYPDGILVVQDGFNFTNKLPDNQNFKIVSLTKIIDLVK